MQHFRTRYQRPTTLHHSRYRTLVSLALADYRTAFSLARSSARCNSHIVLPEYQLLFLWQCVTDTALCTAACSPKSAVHSSHCVVSYTISVPLRRCIAHCATLDSKQQMISVRKQYQKDNRGQKQYQKGSRDSKQRQTDSRHSKQRAHPSPTSIDEHS